MAVLEKERYLLLTHPVESSESYSMTNVLSFFPGLINSEDALRSKINTLDPNYLTIAADQTAKQRKFTIVKPTDDLTFLLLRAFLKDVLMKIALIFGTDNLTYLATLQSSDAKIKLVKENQPYQNAKADVVHFEFNGAIMTTELSLPQKQ